MRLVEWIKKMNACGLSLLFLIELVANAHSSIQDNIIEEEFYVSVGQLCERQSIGNHF